LPAYAISVRVLLAYVTFARCDASIVHLDDRAAADR